MKRMGIHRQWTIFKGFRLRIFHTEILFILKKPRGRIIMFNPHLATSRQNCRKSKIKNKKQDTKHKTSKSHRKEKCLQRMAINQQQISHQQLGCQNTVG